MASAISVLKRKISDCEWYLKNRKFPEKATAEELEAYHYYLMVTRIQKEAFEIALKAIEHEVDLDG